MTNKAKIEIFNQFLRDNNCASKFYVNRAINRNWRKRKGKDTPLTRYFSRRNPSNIIVAAFLWHKTYEKSNFWIRISDLWVIKVSELQLNK